MESRRVPAWPTVRAGREVALLPPGPGAGASVADGASRIRRSAYGFAASRYCAVMGQSSRLCPRRRSANGEGE